MKLSLYTIQEEYIRIAESIIDNGGEITEEQSEALALNQQNLETKGTNYGLVIKQMKSDIEQIDSEIARLTALKKSRNKVIDRLEENISQAMQLYQVKELKSPILKISFRASKETVIENENEIPAEYMNEKVVRTPNKTKIKEDIEKGIPVMGAFIRENQNLQIK